MVDAAAADRHVMALSSEVDEDIAVLADRLGFHARGLHEAADGRSALMFHTVINPHQWPGPNAADAIGGAWLHGALCGAAAHLQADARLPDRQAQAADLLEAIRSYEAQCQETGDSKRALARFGLNRDQTALAERAPAVAVELLQADHPMTGQSARQLGVATTSLRNPTVTVSRCSRRAAIRARVVRRSSFRTRFNIGICRTFVAPGLVFPGRRDARIHVARRV
jgi:hypothetical protein